MASSRNTITVDVDAKLTPVAARTLALDMACRAVTPGSSTGFFLSSARQFETYLLTGLSQTGPRLLQGTQVGAEGVSVLVDGDLTPDLAERIRVAVAGVLSQPHPFLCDQCGEPFMSTACTHVQPARGVVR